MSQALSYARIAAFHAIANDTQSLLADKCAALLDLGRETFGLDIGIVARIRGDIYEVFVARPSDGALHSGARFPLDHTYCDITVGSDEPVGFEVASGGPWARHPCFCEFKLEAYLGARILVEGQVWGTLGFSSLSPVARPQPEEDRLFLKLMAQWLGHAIEDGEHRAKLAQFESEAAAARATALGRDIVHAIGEGVLAYENHFPHRVRFVNPAAEAMIGYPENGIVGRRVDEVLSLARAADGPRGPLLARLAEAGTPFEALVTTAWRSEPFPVSFVAARPLTDANLVVLTFRDIGAEWHAREGLRLAEEVFEYSPEAILVTDSAGTILRVNPAFTLITGYRPEEAIGRNPRILRSERHDADFYAALWRGLLDTGHWHGEIWDRRKNGETYPKWLCINAVRLPSGDIRYVALFADISERKAHEERIDHLAHHDALTGLANRRQLQERALHLLARARHGDTGAALLLIDLDRFKHINDSLGHDIGDQLLIEVAGRLNAAVRASDVVARLGGDEFVVLLEGIAVPDAVAPVAEKIRAALASPYEIAAHVLHTSPSIGIALSPANGDNLEALMKAADIAMYQVKAQTRNGWRFFAPDMDEAVRKRHQLEADLRDALPAGQLAVHYQPQFDTHGGRVIAWEALLRWNHPERGAVPPEDFIPLAEECGLIVPLGAWVLETACRDAMAWSAQRGSAENIAVNVSAKQIDHGGFEETVAAVLALTGLPATRLELELTESALFGNTPHMRETLAKLRSLGVKLTLDDFGTGYSSLAGLTHFTVDRLKIDRGFTAALDQPGNAAIVAAVVALAAALGLDVVAEGVETCDQLAFLMDKGCMRAQGFLYGRPMTPDAVAGFGVGGTV